ncbi:Di-haem oxidoreductase, putative peroxidase [Neorhodopirellula lusitana]|uniref:Di-haem oxidoreductase, putative peroxidase n=1 Tax=Neorhodopirellula lusitana TaxID=445327 RepID=A0ABY1Q0U7_9BACT|nr:di-heme oxidoredictase family protein [Neorhodopirellula lusitana]SMP54282.1 Di-haem oxidoreductase, putative peroxidase [Neorhodopirellula lusitana]
MNPRLLCSFAGILWLSSAWAVSPQSIMEGKLLFEKEWHPSNPIHGSDGLGPLFNATSCVACHQQGGTGGAGGAEFNAKSIGIEAIEIYGDPITSLSLASLISRFHPDFVQGEGNIVNVANLPHHGGSQTLRQFHDAMTARAGAEFSEEGGPLEASEVQIANASPILFEQEVDGYRIRIAARMYERNTTALFGAGQIDMVSDELLDTQVKKQRAHREISGRPSTLEDGRYGKFGWRANVATLLEFTDQACANEMGLQTRRKPQASDVTNPTYQNSAFDISDKQVKSLGDFVAALPAPRRQPPNNPRDLAALHNGETLFNSIGCSVCHVQDMGPAQGIYSDLLLHDMGGSTIDLNHAEPYIVDRELAYNEVESTVPKGFTYQTNLAYYGETSTIQIPTGTDNSIGMNSASLRSPRYDNIQRPLTFSFYAPESPPSLTAFRFIGSKLNPDTKNNWVALERTKQQRSPQKARTRIEAYEQMNIESTRFNQEWRTAPLWGLRDSAPYYHDGRAETVLEAIAMHSGESEGTRDRFLNLSYEDRQDVLAFLDSLVAPH